MYLRHTAPPTVGPGVEAPLPASATVTLSAVATERLPVDSLALGTASDGEVLLAAGCGGVVYVLFARTGKIFASHAAHRTVRDRFFFSRAR